MPCDEVSVRSEQMLIKQLDFDTVERRSWRAGVARTPETHIFTTDFGEVHGRRRLRSAKTLQNRWELSKNEPAEALRSSGGVNPLICYSSGWWRCVQYVRKPTITMPTLRRARHRWRVRHMFRRSVRHKVLALSVFSEDPFLSHPRRALSVFSEAPFLSHPQTCSQRLLRGPLLVAPQTRSQRLLRGPLLVAPASTA